MYDASNRKDIREAEKAAARIERDRIEFLTAALSTVQGRTWFYHFLEDSHLFSDPFSGDPYREAYLKGERNVGLRIFAEISQHCPNQYIQMIKEANERLNHAAARSEYRSGQNSRRDLEGRSAAGDSDPDGAEPEFNLYEPEPTQ